MWHLSGLTLHEIMKSVSKLSPDAVLCLVPWLQLRFRGLIDDCGTTAAVPDMLCTVQAKGETPLHVASTVGLDGAVPLLIKWGAVVNARTVRSYG